MTRTALPMARASWLRRTAPGSKLTNSTHRLVLPQTEHAFVVRRLADQAPWVIGRAGMEYRDLIPSRLGGAMIASHIRVPDGGPVPDMVHFHKVGFPADLLHQWLGRCPL
jgi:hypothetical protein